MTSELQISGRGAELTDLPARVRAQPERLGAATHDVSRILLAFLGGA